MLNEGINLQIILVRQSVHPKTPEAGRQRHMQERDTEIGGKHRCYYAERKELRGTSGAAKATGSREGAARERRVRADGGESKGRFSGNEDQRGMNSFSLEKSNVIFSY